MASERWAQEGAELRERVAVACRVLAMEGHTDITQGHVSARHPGTSFYWIKASGLGLDEVSADDVVLVDLEGNLLWGTGRPHSELPIHAEIYRARPEVMAVVHTHPPYATAFAAADVPLRPVSHEGALFWPDVPRYTFTTDLVVTREQGEALARTLGSARACLMRNHGIVTVGASVEEAALFALQLERAAKLQILAACLGPYTWTPDAEVAQKAAHLHSPRQLDRNWSYYVRKLKRWERGLVPQPVPA